MLICSPVGRHHRHDIVHGLLARLKHTSYQLPGNTVIVLDEPAMCDTRTRLALQRAAAEAVRDLLEVGQALLADRARVERGVHAVGLDVSRLQAGGGDGYAAELDHVGPLRGSLRLGRAGVGRDQPLAHILRAVVASSMVSNGCLSLRAA